MKNHFNQTEGVASEEPLTHGIKRAEDDFVETYVQILGFDVEDAKKLAETVSQRVVRHHHEK